jgi:hypothetical protein
MTTKKLGYTAAEIDEAVRRVYDLTGEYSEYPGTDRPMFRVRNSANAQHVPFNTWVLVDWDVEELDNTNAFNMSTSQFTPQVAGWYYLSGTVELLGTGTAFTGMGLAICKNGSMGTEFSLGYHHGNYGTSITTSRLVYLNGTTDSIELQVYADATPNLPSVEADSWFFGFLIPLTF